MKNLKKISVVFIAFIILLLSAEVSLAAVRIPGEYYPQGAPTLTPGGAIPASGNQAGNREIESARIAIMQRIINVLLGIAGVVAVYFIVTNGFWLIVSGGSEETVTQRKKGLTWAVLGLVLIILSYSIISFIISVTFTADQPAEQLGGPEAVPGSAGMGDLPRTDGGSNPTNASPSFDEAVPSEESQEALS